MGGGEAERVCERREEDEIGFNHFALLQLRCCNAGKGEGRVIGEAGSRNAQR